VSSGRATFSLPRGHQSRLYQNARATPLVAVVSVLVGPCHPSRNLHLPPILASGLEAGALAYVVSNHQRLQNTISTSCSRMPSSTRFYSHRAPRICQNRHILSSLR
jgi:hypothetical protein